MEKNLCDRKIQEPLSLNLENSNLDPLSYQICKNWFKSRNHQALSKEEIQQYQKISTNLQEIMAIMEEVKTAVHNQQLKKLEILETTRCVVADKLGIEPEKVTPVANLSQDLGVSSLDALELFMALEETFDIKISDEVARTIKTVQNIIDCVSQTSEIVLSI